jgi:hypothetical protein
MRQAAVLVREVPARYPCSTINFSLVVLEEKRALLEYRPSLTLTGSSFELENVLLLNWATFMPIFI